MPVRAARKRTGSLRATIISSRANGRLARKHPPRPAAIATSRTARDINRQVVFHLIRRHQPISRAELARLSQLQRSTVSSITEQLIAERLVTMGAQGNLPRGRKPTFLHLNNNQVVALGVEIRPEETTLVVADLSLNFLTRETMPTFADARQFIAELNQRIIAIQTAAPQLTFAGIGITLPGRLDPVSRRIVFAPSLPWPAVDLKTPVEQASGLPVEIENVANASGLAELWSGRYPESVQNLIAITVAEGVEVGMVLNGRLVSGAGGLAGEFGHVIVHEKGPKCRCGKTGCLAACGSNLGAIGYFKEQLTKKSRSATSEISFTELLQRAARNEPQAINALHRMAHFLGAGIAMLVAGLSPDVIVVTGELAHGWMHIGPIVDEVVARRLPIGFRTRILPVAPESQLTLRGAVVLVLQNHFGIRKIL